MGEFNIKSSTIEKGLELAKDLLQSLVGKPIEEMGLLFSDNVKVWRLRNQVRNLERVREIVRKGNITTKQVNMKVLFPYLEAVSLEEDEELHEMWANLFVNYIDAESKLEITVFPEILKQLSTKDVQILKDFYNGDVYYDNYGLPRRKDFDKLMNYTPIEVANLERLGITRPLMRKSDWIRNNSRGWMGGMLFNSEFPMDLRISKFGDEFYKACQSNCKKG